MQSNYCLEVFGHRRRGTDLMLLAGLRPAAVLRELMNPDGSMARGGQVAAYARQFDLVVPSVADVVGVHAARQAEPA